MRAVFADTSFYQAILNPRDHWHEKALHISKAYRGSVVTSEYVLCELGALMSHGYLRLLFLDLFNNLKNSPYTTVIPSSSQYFNAGLAIFSHRPDKNWSLTDCISFTIMQEQDITEALTGDNHFIQAGFQAMFLQ